MKDLGADSHRTLAIGFGDPTFERFVANRLDDHFAEQADERMHACLRGCRIVLEQGSGGPGAIELSWNLAKAAAHWRQVAEDRRELMAVVATEAVELVEAAGQ